MASARAALLLRPRANPMLFSAHGLRYTNTPTTHPAYRAREGRRRGDGGPGRREIIQDRSPQNKECLRSIGLWDLSDMICIEEKILKNYHAAAKQVDNALLVFRRFISEGNELRHPVTKAEIIVEVERLLNLTINIDNLPLQSTLSSLGEFELPLSLPTNIPWPEGKLKMDSQDQDQDHETLSTLSGQSCPPSKLLNDI